MKIGQEFLDIQCQIFVISRTLELGFPICIHKSLLDNSWHNTSFLMMPTYGIHPRKQAQTVHGSKTQQDSDRKTVTEIKIWFLIY